MLNLKNVNRLNTCCFIGGCNQNNLFLFDEKSLYYEDIKLKIEKNIVYLIEKLFVTNFMSGMNIGFEQCAAETVLEKKEIYPQITLEGVLPYEAHSINWSMAQRDKYYSIMEKSDRELLLQYHYTNDCMKKRNQYMIDNSKYSIFFLDGTSNIGNLILYAKLKRRVIIIIDSNKFQFLGSERIF